jgi:hypothetical protein
MSDPAPYRCPWCGSPAWLEPGEIDPPVDYCHPGDHGSPEDYEEMCG